MDAQKVDLFIVSNGKYFPQESIWNIRERLTAMDDSRWARLSSIQFKNPIAALILSIFLGGLGVDRFFVGQIGAGILKLITLGGFGIWTIIDWFFIMGVTKRRNLSKLQICLP